MEELDGGPAFGVETVELFSLLHPIITAELLL